MPMTYAPSPSGLQGLLNIYAKFGLEYDVEFKPIKLLCMVFKPHGFHLKYPYIHMNLNKLAYVKQAYGIFAVHIVIVWNDLKDDILGVKLHLFHAYCCTIYCSKL